MSTVKYKEGTLDALSNGWEQDYTLRLYKNTTLSEDGQYSDFTEATADTGYAAKTLTWASGTVSWDSVEGKYKMTWPNQEWSDVTNLDADGWYITDSGNVRVYGAEVDTLGAAYTTLTAIPVIYMG